MEYTQFSTGGSWANENDRFSLVIPKMHHNFQ